MGTKIDITVTVINNGTTDTGNLAVHIDVTDPREDSSVDPEDWVPELTKQLPNLGPGEQGSLSWTLNPIAGGDFALYAVALRNDGGTEPTVVAVSNGVPVVVTEERSINPDGVLPLIVGFPVVIGGVLVWRNRPHGRDKLDPAAV